MNELTLKDIRLDRANLIEASAGTGKTWTIAALYIRLLLEKQLSPEEILVVTYTRAATAELKERIRRRIAGCLKLLIAGRDAEDDLERMILAEEGDRKQMIKCLTRALFAFDDASIFTIHGFCQRALTENAFESSSLFDTEMITDQSALVQAIADDYWRTHILTESEEFVGQLVAARLTPSFLLKPFNGQLQNRLLKLIPQTDNPDVYWLGEQRRRLFKDAAAIWSVERELIVGLLKEPGLNQQSYRPVQVDKAALQLDDWFSGGNPCPVCDRLTLFCSSNIEKKVTKGATAPRHAFFGLADQLLTSCEEADHAFKQKLLYRQADFHRWLQRELPRRKAKLNQRCYDDLLIDLEQALSGPSGDALAVRLRERFKAALIDEFQDTDPLQWQIFSRMSQDPEYPLFLIGDPKQAIYSFRGADIYAYLTAANTVDCDLRWTLKTNRRSVPLLVEGVNKLFGNCQEDPFLSEGIRFDEVHHQRGEDDRLIINEQPDQKPLQLLIYPGGDKVPSSGAARKPVAEAVATEIAKLLAERALIVEEGRQRQVSPADMAVLVKSHAQADLIQQALLALQIPSVQHGNTTIFETQEALDLLRVIKAVASPSNEALVKEALLGGLVGINANILADMIDSDDGRWEDWLSCFFDMSRIYHRHGIVAMTTHLLEKCHARSRLLCLPDGERRLTNLMHCVELVHHNSLESAAGIEASIAWLEQRISRQQEDETSLLRLETDSAAVRIVTIHTSKGLQYPITFLPFAWDAPSRSPERALFHQPDGSLVLDLGSDDLDKHLEMTRTEQAAEAIRLLYVGLTRAEFRCYVVWGNIGQAVASPLRRFLHPKLSKPFKDYQLNDILADLKEIEQKTVAMEVREFISGQVEPYQPDESEVELESRTFTGRIVTDWRVSSFSSIASGSEKIQQPHDYDALVLASPERNGDGYTIFDFPRGAAAGTCLHELFEELDFTDVERELEPLVTRILLKNGYGEQWLQAVNRMVRAITAAPLLPGESGFSLNKLKPGGWMCEMEFFLPLGHLTSHAIRELFSGLLVPEHHGDFDQVLANLQLQDTRGILHGFMDMIFEHAGRYYIIDWKSNHLGDCCQAYHQQAVRHAMVEHSYILQYHLYTLALDRLLRSTLPEYDYERHFGGAIYIFLRGIDISDPTLGIYRDRPSPQFIERAAQTILSV